MYIFKQFKLDRSEVASNLNFPLYIHGNTNLKNPNKFSIDIEKIHNFLSISNCHFSLRLKQIHLLLYNWELGIKQNQMN